MTKAEKISHILSSLFWAVVMMPIFGENAVSAVLRNDGASKLLSLVSCVVIVCACLLNRGKFNRFHIILFFLVLLRINITLYAVMSGVRFGGRNNFITPYGITAYLAVFWLIDALMDRPDKMRSLFHGLVIVTSVLVLMNFFLTAQLKPANNIAVLREALATHYTNSRSWLFGHRNNIFVQHLLWMLFTCISCRLNNKSYMRLFLLQSAYNLIVGVFSWNSTMLLCSALMPLFAVSNIFPGIYTYIAVYFVVEISIVFLRIQDIFSFVIVGLLHRGLTFTGRIYIWDYYIRQYMEGSPLNWLLGNFGIHSYPVNSHNMMLGLLAFTGIIGLVMYFSLLYISAPVLYAERNSEMGKFVALILFGFLINALTMEFFIQPLAPMFIGYEAARLNQRYGGT